MRFDVKFGRRSFVRNVDVMGKGAVYLDETGVVVEGDFPRFYIPVVARVLRQIICATGTRTIPFSKIGRYAAPSIWSRYHRVVYSLPDRSKFTVSFKMLHRSKSNDAEFATRFQEYSAAARSFSQT